MKRLWSCFTRPTRWVEARAAGRADPSAQGWNAPLPSVEREVEVINKHGLHARPGLVFVQTANRYTSKIEVSNGSLTVNGKSIMTVMRLAAVKGTILQIVADGEDAEEAADCLVRLVASGFGEDSQPPPPADPGPATPPAAEQRGADGPPHGDPAQSA